MRTPNAPLSHTSGAMMMRCFVSTVELTEHGPILQLPPHCSGPGQTPSETDVSITEAIAGAAKPVVVWRVLKGDRDLETAQVRAPFGLPVTESAARDAEVGHWIHDINNQLLIITSHLETLTAETNSRDRRDAARAVQSAQERLIRLSRQCRERTSGTRDLNQLTEGVAATLGPSFSAQVRWDLQADRVPISVNCDSARLLILNLLSSLLGLISDGQTLRVRTHPGDSQPPTSVLRVELPPEKSSADEDDFFSQEGPDLAAANALARRLGLTLEVDSNAAGEVAVQVCFPISPANSEPSRAARRVMIVDSQEDVRDFLAKFLKDQRFEVLEAQHGADALAQVARQPGPLDLLITDMTLPEMSGRAIAAVLRSERPHLPVLYTSGLAGGNFTPEERCSEFLAKPFGIPDLLSAIARLLNEPQL